MMMCSWNNQHVVVDGIKCPIRFHPTKVEKRHSTGATIKDRIMASDIERYTEIHKQQTYEFDEDHIFCSPECCKAFILKNKGDKLYENSICFLMQITKREKKIIAA